MRIGVRGDFLSPQIFGGRLDRVGAVCDLEISRDYSLIYAEIKNLDVIQALNHAFGLGWEDDRHLNVASAGFFTFSTKSAPSQPLNQVFPGSPIPDAVARTALPEGDTTSFWLTVDLAGGDGDGPFVSLPAIGVANGSQLSLSATFRSGQVASKALEAADYTLDLHGAIELFDLFKFHNVSIRYRMEDARQLSIRGDVEASLFGHDFRFSGAVVSDSQTQTVRADLEAPGDSSVDVFRGLFPNITFKGLGFNLYYSYGENADPAKFMVRGGCKFGGQDFTGLLYMDGTRPILASVVFTRAASITKLFDQCLPGVSWPNDLIELILKKDSQAYYNNSGGPLTLPFLDDGRPTVLPAPGDQSAQVTYQQGFNLSAAFDLTLVNALEVEGVVVVKDDGKDRGVSAEIRIGDPIDIYVLTIRDQDDHHKGPMLSIDSIKGSMSFKGALLFFQQAFGADATVAATRKDGELFVTTKLTAPQDYPPLLKAGDSLTFTYSKSEGFALAGWPAIDFDDIIDLFETLKSVVKAREGDCGELADFLNTEALGQRYTMTPSFSSATGALTLSLSISYALSFQSHDFAKVIVPDAVVIPIQSHLDLDDLWTVILGYVQAAAESLVTALLDNGDAIATFLALFLGRKAAIDGAATLICKGLTNSLVEGATEAGANAAAAAPPGGPGGLVGAVVAAVVAANGHRGGGNGSGDGGDGAPPDAPDEVVAAITGNAITAQWALSSGAWNYVVSLRAPDGGVFAGPGKTAFDASTYPFGPVRPSAALPADCVLEVVASNGWGDSPPRTANVLFLAAPTNLASRPAVATGPDMAVEVTWSGARGDTAYAVAVTGGKTGNLTRPVANVILTFTPSDPPGDYTVVVTAHGDAASVPSLESAPLTLTRLAPPAGLAADTTATSIEARWDSVTNAAAYQLTWIRPDGEVGSQTMQAEPGQAQGGAIPLPAPPVDGVWILAVQALPAQGPGRFVASPFSAPLDVKTGSPLTPAQRAKDDHERGLDGAACGLDLIKTFGTLTPLLLAIAMAQGGYSHDAAADGLMAAFPSITSAQMARALAGAFPPTPENLARACFADGDDGAACGSDLIQAFGALTPVLLAIAMAQGGYSHDAAADGLMAAFPSITSAQMARALAGAFPPTPENLARACFADGDDGATCGSDLIQVFGALTPVLLAIAMAQGGYSHDATADGLMAAFPSITSAQMARALAQAYS